MFTFRLDNKTGYAPRKQKTAGYPCKCKHVPSWFSTTGGPMGGRAVALVPKNGSCTYQYQYESTSYVCILLYRRDNAIKEMRNRKQAAAVRHITSRQSTKRCAPQTASRHRVLTPLCSEARRDTAAERIQHKKTENRKQRSNPAEHI